MAAAVAADRRFGVRLICKRVHIRVRCNGGDIPKQQRLVQSAALEADFAHLGQDSPYLAAQCLGGRGEQFFFKRFLRGDERRVADEEGGSVFSARLDEISHPDQRRQPFFDKSGGCPELLGDLFDALRALGTGDADVLCQQVTAQSVQVGRGRAAADVHLQPHRLVKFVGHIHSLLQTMFGLAQMPAQRAFGNAEPLCDLAAAFVLVIEQHNRFAAESAQPHHLAAQLLKVLAVQQRFLGCLASVRLLGKCVVVHAFPVPRRFAQPGVVGVQTDTVDVAVHVCNRLLFPVCLAERGEDGLRQVLGVLPAVRFSDGKAENLFRVAFDERVPLHGACLLWAWFHYTNRGKSGFVGAAMENISSAVSRKAGRARSAARPAGVPMPECLSRRR